MIQIAGICKFNSSIDTFHGFYTFRSIAQMISETAMDGDSADDDSVVASLHPAKNSRHPQSIYVSWLQMPIAHSARYGCGREMEAGTACLDEMEKKWYDIGASDGWVFQPQMRNIIQI